MPKIIPDIRAAAIAAVRRSAAVRGWKALQIRTLAASCGVAAGTLYNYFPSREAIAAAAIREDWLEASRRLRTLREGSSAMENLRAVHGELVGFMRRYRTLWSDAAGNQDRKGGNEVGAELRQILEELDRIVDRAIGEQRAAGSIDAAFLPKFVSRALVQWAQDPRVSWPMLSGIVGRLIGGNRSQKTHA